MGYKDIKVVVIILSYLYFFIKVVNLIACNVIKGTLSVFMDYKIYKNV